MFGLRLGGVLVKHMESVRQEACIYLWSRIAFNGDRGKISFFRNKWVCVLKLRVWGTRFSMLDWVRVAGLPCTKGV